MSRFRWLPVATRCLLGLIQAAPLVGLVVAVVVDRGPEGDSRLSSHLFPVVLWVFDDFAWTCARNSLVFALVVSLAALALGVGLRSQIGRLRTWRGLSLAGLVVASLAASPALMALGLTGLFGPVQGWPWPISTSDPAIGGTSLETWRGLPFFFVWTWASLPAAVAWVWLATESSFERLEPSWAATARVAGAGRFRIWRDLSWPIIRPTAARAAGQVFVFALFEPGAPLILGLRRTLAFQIVDAAGQPEPFPRAATWVVMTGLFGLAAWAGFRWRGGRPILDAPAGAAAAGPQPEHAIRPTSPRTLLAILSLTAWSLMAWLPLLGLLGMALGGGLHAGDSGETSLASLLGRLGRFGEPPMPELAFNSLVFGFEVACAILAISWLVPRYGPRPTRGRLLRPSFLMPALVQGIAVLALPWVAALASTFLLESGWSNLGLGLEKIAGALDPNQASWLPMACAVVLFLLPWVLKSRQDPTALVGDQARGDSAFEAALLAGATRWRARALSSPDRRVRTLRRFVLVWALAATNVTPALLFLSSASAVTLGPGILILAGQGGDGPSQAAAMALGVIAVNIGALALGRPTGDR